MKVPLGNTTHGASPILGHVTGGRTVAGGATVVQALVTGL